MCFAFRAMEAGQGDGQKEKEERRDEIRYENLGLTTGEALEILKRDINRVIEEYEKDCRKNKYTKA